ncbi:MAG: hypothetical protein KJ957_06865, partial [Candidatus Omnitrophica bacterium]|nr:hypothetical protein [Candidatus Omnitrophota bacterium]
MITRKIMRVLKGTRFLHMMVLVFILGFLAGAPPWAHADIPRYINYQGKLTDAEDNPVTGDVSITVRIYDAGTGGTALWTEAQTVTVTRGIFNILLGNTEALSGLDFNEAYWYSVEVESDGEMTPRQRLTSVAYAVNADKLDGYDSSQFLRADTSTELTGDLTVTTGVITAGANEDITIDPTGTGNIVMAIDSTSGDFKITDGTTNWVLVDSETGNVTIAKNLTVNGIIYGTLASTGGDSIFSSIIVTGASDLQGSLDVGGNTDMEGNLDVAGNLDITGTVDIIGATSMASSLDVNSNIDLDYSGTYAALDVNQVSTGAAAQFTGGEVVIGSDTSNAYALSSGELYVQGDLEVDGTIYGDITSTGSTTLGSTTLDDLTVTGTSDLQGNVDISAGIDITGAANFAGGTTYNVDSTGAATLNTLDVTPGDLTSGGTDDYSLNITQTLNDIDTAGGSDVYRGIKLNLTETGVTGWDNVYLMDLQVGDTTQFSVDDSGNVIAAGTLNMSSNKITSLAEPTVATDGATKNYVDSVASVTGGGWTDDGDGVFLNNAADNVGIGTDETDTYKLNVSGSTNTTTLYIADSLIASTHLSDSANIGMLNEDETISGSWQTGTFTVNTLLDANNDMDIDFDTGGEQITIDSTDVATTGLMVINDLRAGTNNDAVGEAAVSIDAD